MEVLKTDNGLTYILYPIETRYVTVAAVTGFGHMDETKKESAHALEHMLLKGTGNRNYRDIMETLKWEALGGYNAETNTDMTKMYAIGAKRRMESLVDLFADALQNSTFSEKILEGEKVRIITETNERRENSAWEIYPKAYELFFDSRRLSELAYLPTTEDIKRIKTCDLESQYRRFFNPDNSVFIVYGGIDTYAAEKRVEMDFADFRGTTPKRIFEELKPRNERNEIEMGLPGLENYKLSVMMPAPLLRADNREERIAMRVASNLLDSNLTKILQDDLGLVYGVGAGCNSFLRYGASGVDTESVPDKSEEVRRIVYREIERLHDGEIDATFLKKLENARQDTSDINEDTDPFNGPVELAALDMAAILTSGDYRYAIKAAGGKNDVDIDKVREVCSKYLDLDKSVTISVKNKA